MRKLLQLIALGVALLLPRAVPAALPAQPNFIFILIDDMGYGDLGCYGGSAKTPELDRVAKEGIRFTQFYVTAPICSPSRCGVITGQWPQRWGITSFLENRASNTQRGMAQWLDLKAPSIARTLKSAGYATGHFGKWHLGGQRDVGEAPLITEYGFDASLTNFEGLGDRVLPVMGGFDGRPEERLRLGVGSEKLGRGEITWAPRHEVTARFADKATGFIIRAAAEGKPFYINLWPDDVHSPFSPPPGKPADTKEARYRSVLENLDAQLGSLFDEVRSHPDLFDNTLVLVASDNGPEPGAGKAGGFRGSKGFLYEGGLREPLLAWGGLVAESRRGTVDETTILSALDIAPSFTRLANPAAELAGDGEDFSATLTGRVGPGKPRAKPLFWRRPPDRAKMGDTPAPDLAIREGDWKLLMQAGGSSVQLYNLASDPAEGNNLSSAEPGRAKELATILQAWDASLPPVPANR
ncbi:MAG: sulfatase-like hydrolase/transferase [Verrucomicrobium sp.]